MLSPGPTASARHRSRGRCGNARRARCGRGERAVAAHAQDADRSGDSRSCRHVLRHGRASRLASQRSPAWEDGGALAALARRGPRAAPCGRARRDEGRACARPPPIGWSRGRRSAQAGDAQRDRLRGVAGAAGLRGWAAGDPAGVSQPARARIRAARFSEPGNGTRRDQSMDVERHPPARARAAATWRARRADAARSRRCARRGRALGHAV